MKRREYSALYDINVTNLVDVVLVLLIIFMIAAPMFQSGVEISLPKAKASQEDLGVGIVVTITNDSKIYVDERITNLERFQKTLTEIRLKKGGKFVYLRADKEVPYGLVVNIVGRIKELGIENLGLVTEPEG